MESHRTKSDSLLIVVEEYRRAGEPWPATKKEIASWAIRNDKWQPTLKAQIDICADEIAVAMRDEVFKDAQERIVRKKYALPVSEPLPDGRHKQRFLWLDMTDESTTTEQMHEVFQYQRKQVLNDCTHLKSSLDSYNENYNRNQPIQLSFDFEPDLAELSQPVEYVGGNTEG
jgi:hypothetical protein